MKYIAGILTGACLLVAGTAFAATLHGIVETGQGDGISSPVKYYDYDAKVTCYKVSNQTNTALALSCLK